MTASCPALKPLSALGLRLLWRTALVRCGLSPSDLQLMDVRSRGDGQAFTVTVRSRTEQAARLATEDVHRFGWALRRRAVALPGDPYTPNRHRILLETEPLVVGELPAAERRFPQGCSTEVLLGRHAVTGDPYLLRLRDRDTGSRHVLVAGTTGGGKSNTVNVLLRGLVAAGVSVVGIDGKGGATLRPWEPHLAAPMVDPIADPSTCEELLLRLVELMDLRQRTPVGGELPLVLVVEEWAALPAKPPAIGDMLDRLAAQGRSASIGLILTTQRPTSNVGAVRTSTRGNLTTRIAHSTVGDRAASEAILGSSTFDAANLPTDPPGLTLVRCGGAELDPVRVFRCDGPPDDLDVVVRALDEVEEWDRVARHEVDLERTRQARLSLE